MKTEMVLLERLKTSQALEESERRYKRLLASTTDYIYTVQITDGRAGSTQHGEGCAAVTGYGPAEFASDPFLWFRVIHEEDRPAVMAHINGILQGLTPPVLEHRIIHRSGSIRWISNACIPHRDNAGRLISYDGLITEITARKRAELVHTLQYKVACSLAEARRLHTALPEVLQAICEVLLWHYAAFWSCPEPEAPPRREAGFCRTRSGADESAGLAPLSMAREEALVRLALASSEPVWVPDVEPEAGVFYANGRLHGALAVPLRENGVCQGVLLACSRERLSRDPQLEQGFISIASQLRQCAARARSQDDLEQSLARLEKAHEQLARRGDVLKQIVRRLHQSNRELKAAHLHLIQAARHECVGTLAAGVAHEVKNPLQTILLGLDYLEQRAGAGDPAVDDTLTQMREAVGRANRIVQELLSLSARTRFERVASDFNAVVDRCLILLHGRLAQGHIRLERQLADDLPRVWMDPARIEQVLLNLLLNAAQAMRNGGCLTVRTCAAPALPGQKPAPSPIHPAQSGDRVVVAEVCDTGPGIRQEDLARVFDAFYTTKPPGEGTGLGLTVARRIIDLHGGVLELANAPSGGAVATVRLRAMPPPKAADSNPGEGSSGSPDNTARLA